MKIKLITEEPDLLNRGIDYFWKQWGNESNRVFYKNCIENSLKLFQPLPKFYLMLDEGQIIGSYALLCNDLISRQDLMPWLACLYVEENYRNRGYGDALLQHGLREAFQRGFPILYLSTDLENFYEKKGWHFHANGYGVKGDEFKIYAKATQE